ncbi:hypothetical protein QFC22_004423 [Naganishia vaughanmartiniae]|uniref:Uncharacterized protein n=1 Tax=Naganishia vaughanmartiniae TaxID=1424756 RepID=A0ACC2X1H0_9TREE|nr:hypothetical protein QFC22_004423 [Naganishia vaughanmartiniae]
MLALRPLSLLRGTSALRTRIPALQTATLRHARAYTSSQDPSHPHLYYHQLRTSPPLMGLSFLPEAPKKGAESRTIIGFLPVGEDVGLEDFRENVKFMYVGGWIEIDASLLQSEIKAGLATGAGATVETEASARGSDGYMHIADGRNLPPPGRIPEPHDIIGSVYVQSGKILPETYEAQPMYRICTQDGVCVLPYGLDEHVLKALKEVADKE